MRTTVNPGRYLELVASLELERVTVDELGDVVLNVRDRDSGAIVTLIGLLESFREDPDDDVIGRVRLTIEPAGR